MLDTEGCGTISINELIAWVEAEQETGKRSGRFSAGATLEPIKTGGPACGANSPRPPATVRNRRRGPPLASEAVAKIKTRIKSAAYTGYGVRQLNALFSRSDRDGSGKLSDDDVKRTFRRILRIVPAVISDEDISSLCGMVDCENTGFVGIEDLVAFIEAELKPPPLWITYGPPANMDRVPRPASVNF